MELHNNLDTNVDILKDINLKNIESERPSNIELPRLNNKEINTSKHFENREDSARTNIELPRIVASKESSLDKNENVENKYHSNYEDRIAQTPNESGERGYWEGERGESKFVPKDPEVKKELEEYGKKDIDYKDAIPDFSEVSASTVEIDNMTDNRASNFRQCDEKCAEQWNKENRDGKNDWTGRDVQEWRKSNEYSWHECNDTKTCQLVPRKIHECFTHLGGVGECKIRDNIKNNGEK